VGSLKTCFDRYSHLKEVLPAEGYFPQQLLDLEATIRQTPCDWVLIATPIDLSRLIAIGHPFLRVTYRVEDWGEPTLEQVVENFMGQKNISAEGRNSP
jgi:predicted GTPase